MDEWLQMAASVNKQRIDSDRRKINESKRKLTAVIEQKFRTAFIGALSQFERRFGYLWEKDTQYQERFRELWAATRNAVLDNGNEQMRAVLAELEQYEVKFTGYQLVAKPPEDECRTN